MNKAEQKKDFERWMHLLYDKPRLEKDEAGEYRNHITQRRYKEFMSPQKMSEAI